MIETIRTFTALSEEFVELFMKHHPVAATEAGIHDYDHLMPDDSPDGLKSRAAWLRDLDQRLVASVPWDELPLEPRVDFALLRSRIASLRADLEEVKVPQKNPGLFLDRAYNAVHLLLARSFAPLDERKEAAVARLMAIPEYLESVKPNLHKVPPVLLASSLEMAAHGPTFVDEVVRTLLRQFPGEAERLEHAGNRARSGFLKFHDWMERDLKPRAEGTFAIGERWMNYKLEREHLLGMDCTSLAALGEEQVAKTRVLLEDEARRIDSSRTWQELIGDTKRRHPEPLKLKEAYQAETDRARRFVVEQHIAPIAAGEKLQVIDTPVFERSVVPYAAYLPPGPFDEDQTGFFYVTPIDLTRRKEEQQQQLEGHNYAGLALTTVHESYPGHHLQLGHANLTGSRLRRLADSNLFAEGWALYCEELMHEQGFYLDPLTRLYQLKDLLWRACRVVLDVGLHTGQVTFMQAVDYLREQAMVERVNAVAEVKRYTLTPTQPMSYLVGKLELLAIRAETEHRLGSRFDLYEFHAALLQRGSLPPALVREELAEALK